MATDVKLDQVDGTYVVLEGRVVKTTASDIIIDAPARRKSATPFRRALVHDQNDGLTINFAGDYPGGVTLTNVASITPQPSQGLGGFGTLVVHGGISYEAQGINVHGGAAKVTVSLDAELSKLQAQINDLTAKLAALQAKLPH